MTIKKKEGFDWKGTLGTIWDKLSLTILKAFRGLICEKKEGGWELSKGNLAFWIVLVHCLMVWSGRFGRLEGDLVPEQEFWLLAMLLGYATTKKLAVSSVDLVAAFRNK